jgi:tetratricopeptide (TPR) repeat protein
MRIILIISVLFLLLPGRLFAQNDFVSLDKKSYDQYMSGDYRNLKLTAEEMFSQGIDYYYLRMRLGILAFNTGKYSVAVDQFRKALSFNSLDTISAGYIYSSYLNSGRVNDATLFLKKYGDDKLNPYLRKSSKANPSEVYIGSSFFGTDVTTYTLNPLSYEAMRTGLSLSAGFEGSLNQNFRISLAYKNFSKTGTNYSPAFPAGKSLQFSQNQFYGKISGYIFPGWEFSVFGQAALYKDASVNNRVNGEFLGGAGIAKNGWKIRSGGNISWSNFDNFSGSYQIRGEGYITFLPKGNLNFYSTTGGMIQSDNNWGETYQVNQEIGFKVLNSLWIETGASLGNSFLYARNQGLELNNSFLIPATSVYGNIILIPGKKIRITVTPFYGRNNVYSWNLNTYSRTNKLTNDLFGGSIKLVYKIR